MLRLPIQWVNRPNSNFRGFSGTVASGSATVGQSVRALPSGELARIEEIVLFDQSQVSSQGKAVTVTLDREIDLSRGDVITSGGACEVAEQFEQSWFGWIRSRALLVGNIISFGSSRANASISSIKSKYNINTFDLLSARSLGLNDIATVSISVDRPVFEPYEKNKALEHLFS